MSDTSFIPLSEIELAIMQEEIDELKQEALLPEKRHNESVTERMERSWKAGDRAKRLERALQEIQKARREQ
jgi:hypothetical protein